MKPLKYINKYKNFLQYRNLSKYILDHNAPKVK